jgi:hypothetical protein
MGDKVTNSKLIELSKRNPYFKNRTGDTSFFIPWEAFLILVASELFDFLPFRNVSVVVDELIKTHRNLYRLLEKNPKQFLAVEKVTNTEMVIEMSYYNVFPILFDTLKVWDWGNRQAVVLVNLEKIYLKVENLFATEGIVIPTGDGK